jgi:hypothetical protein
MTIGFTRTGGTGVFTEIPRCCENPFMATENLMDYDPDMTDILQVYCGNCMETWGKLTFAGES